MSNTSITYNEREIIESSLHQRNPLSIREIARKLCRNPSSIQREIRRNQTNSKWYDSQYADNQAEKRKHKKRICPKTENPTLKAKITQYLARGLSPDLMVGRAKLEGVALSISHTSIYALIRKDAGEGGKLYLKLACKRKTVKKRQFLENKGTFSQAKVRIDQRPPEINSRTELGHWEVDTLVGADHKSHCLTMIERTTRFGYATFLKAPTTEETQAGSWDLKHRFPYLVRSFTCDNGTEFSYLTVKYKDQHIPVYFTYPHAPWHLSEANTSIPYNLKNRYGARWCGALQ